jgi:thymidylate synthase
MMTQRSSDFVVAGGWNIGTGALLTYLIAKVCALRPAELIWNIGDIHIYSNLYDAAKQQMTLEGRPYPKLFIRQRDNIEDFEFEDLNLIGYNPHPSIAVVMNP